jgi:hypothetical protein
MPADYLRRIGDILRSGKPIEERLREFCQETGGFLPGSVSSILLFDRDTEDFYLRTTTLRVSPASQVVHHSAAGTIEDLSLRERRPITLCEVHRSADSRLRGEMFFFPLVSVDEPLGVLLIQSVSQNGVPAEKRPASTSSPRSTSPGSSSSWRLPPPSSWKPSRASSACSTPKRGSTGSGSITA